MKKTIGERIEKLEKAVELLNALSERLWKLENPPKYKYGQYVQIHDYITLQEITGPSSIKILESTLKYQAPLSWSDGSVVRPGFFYWEYHVDVIGTGSRILTEEQLHLLIKNDNTHD